MAWETHISAPIVGSFVTTVETAAVTRQRYSRFSSSRAVSMPYPLRLFLRMRMGISSEHTDDKKTATMPKLLRLACVVQNEKEGLMEGSN
jgi:hypothetical protein